MGKFRDLMKDVTGSNLDNCYGKTAPGVRCKKKGLPKYGGSCGDPKCDSVFSEAIERPQPPKK